MRFYKKITQEATGKLVGWYDTLDHTGDVQTDFDIIEDQSIIEEGDKFVCISVMTNHRYATVSSLEIAFEKVKERNNSTYRAEQKRQKLIDIDKFEQIAQRNSLDERYKDVNPEKKPKKLSPYLARLQSIARIRTEDMHADNEANRAERNWKLQMADYTEALLNH